MATETTPSNRPLRFPPSEEECRPVEQALPEWGIPVLALLQSRERQWWAVVYYCGTRWWYDRPPEGFPGYDPERTFDHHVIDFGLPPEVEVRCWLDLPTLEEAMTG